jgi:hypothetical protein
MTRRMMLGLGALGLTLGLTGCKAQQTAQLESHSVSLGAMAAAENSDDLYRLGAGDAIGREVFTYYVACLRANEYYANEPDSAFLDAE